MANELRDRGTLAGADPRRTAGYGRAFDIGARVSLSRSQAVLVAKGGGHSRNMGDRAPTVRWGRVSFRRSRAVTNCFFLSAGHDAIVMGDYCCYGRRYAVGKTRLRLEKDYQ